VKITKTSINIFSV